MNQEFKLLVDMDNDAKWLHMNFEKIREKFENKFIAIKNRNVIAEGNEFEDVIKKLKKKKENPATVLIKFIHKKGTTIIL